MSKYEVDKIIDEVVKLCEEFPDATYTKVDGSKKTCYYTRGEAGNGKCGCVVGQAIVNAYPELKESLQQVDESTDDPNGYTIVAQLTGQGACPEKDIEGKLQFIRSIQMWQDGGDPWRKCLQASKSRYLI